MGLHGLTSVTLGVPDVDAVASYYEAFGLRRAGDRPGRGIVFATADGGEQLVLRPAGRRRLLEIAIGADDPDDVGRAEASLRRLGAGVERDATSLRARDPGSARDLDIILDDQLWKPSVVEGARGLYNWGPPPPPSFIHPEDLAALMTASHAPGA